jgi:hypothetical protein
MQPLRQIERARVDHRVLQHRRAMRQPRLDGPSPAARGLPVIAQVVGDLAELVPDAVQFRGGQLGEEPIAGAGTRV